MGEILVARLGELAAAAESTKGTKVVNANLVDGTNSKYRIYNLTYEHDVKIFERGTAAATLSRYSHLVGQVLGRITFDMELRKTAVTATEDAWGIFLGASGFKFTSGTGTYSPTTDQSLHKTLTMYAFVGSTGGSSTNVVRRGIRGAIAQACKLSCKIGEPPMWSFSFIGASDDNDTDGTPANTFALKPTDDLLNTITHEAAVPATFQGVTFTYNGSARRISSMEIDFGLQSTGRDDIGSDQGFFHGVITDRAITVTVDPDMSLVAEENYGGQLNIGTEIALSASWSQPAAGGVNARTITMTIPKMQVTAMTHGNRNGIMTAGLTCAVNKNAEPGDDEFTLAITGV